jgi:cytochrome P450
VARLPPGPRAPSVLNALRYARDPLGFFVRLRERHGDVFRISFPSFPDVVYLADPGLVRELFMSDPAQLHAGEANASVLEPALGPRSVLTLDEGAHLRQRKILLAPFHGRAIQRYRELIRESARRDLATWPVGRPFAVREHTQRITLDVILRAVYGLGDDQDLAGAHAVVDEFVLRSDALMLPGPLRRDLAGRGPWARFLRSREELDRIVFEAIAARRAAGDAGERDDVLSLLMRSRDEDGAPPTDAELRDELVTVVGAGHETTATALAWAVERLVRHPDVLARLRASLLDGDDAYLDAVIKETLRIRPVIADVARKATGPIEIGGYTLPRGTFVLASIIALHFREDLYDDPRSFRPERFLDGAPESYAWIPFGGGVRRCLGAAFAHEEMRIILREIALRADLRPASPAGERPRMRNITLAPEHGARVVLEHPLRAADPVATEDSLDDVVA